MTNLRVVTYNIHKCRGMDRRTRPQRIVDVLLELDADIIALQEVLNAEGSGADARQAEYIADELGGYELFFTPACHVKRGSYGNALLSRRRTRGARSYEITWRHQEPRNCQRVDIEVAPPRRLLHVFNLHLGTAFVERRYQARRLLGAEILANPELRAPRLVLGDFNEWTRGLTTRLLSEQFQSVDITRYAKRGRTYPGVLPLLHLDHIYYDAALELQNFSVVKNRLTLVASDHLPLLAEFAI